MVQASKIAQYYQLVIAEDMPILHKTWYFC